MRVAAAQFLQLSPQRPTRCRSASSACLRAQRLLVGAAEHAADGADDRARLAEERAADAERRLREAVATAHDAEQRVRRQTDRQTDSQTDRQTDRRRRTFQTDVQANAGQRSGRWTERYRDRGAKWRDGWMDSCGGCEETQVQKANGDVALLQSPPADCSSSHPPMPFV
jgi:hypothetical protein